MLNVPRVWTHSLIKKTTTIFEDLHNIRSISCTKHSFSSCVLGNEMFIQFLLCLNAFLFFFLFLLSMRFEPAYKGGGKALYKFNW